MDERFIYKMKREKGRERVSVCEWEKQRMKCGNEEKWRESSKEWLPAAGDLSALIPYKYIRKLGVLLTATFRYEFS